MVFGCVFGRGTVQATEECDEHNGLFLACCLLYNGNKGVVERPEGRITDPRSMRGFRK